jgi:hypothetical protein
MEYIGAADYHFWHGVYMGYNSEGLVSIDFLTPTFHMDNQVTRDCVEAFKWGYCFGLELTENEYIELTTYNTPDKVKKEEKLVKIEQNDEKIVNVPIQGNC